MGGNGRRHPPQFDRWGHGDDEIDPDEIDPERARRARARAAVARRAYEESLTDDAFAASAAFDVQSEHFASWLTFWGPEGHGGGTGPPVDNPAWSPSWEARYRVSRARAYPLAGLARWWDEDGVYADLLLSPEQAAEPGRVAHAGAPGTTSAPPPPASPPRTAAGMTPRQLYAAYYKKNMALAETKEGQDKLLQMATDLLEAANADAPSDAPTAAPTPAPTDEADAPDRDPPVIRLAVPVEEIEAGRPWLLLTKPDDVFAYDLRDRNMTFGDVKLVDVREHNLGRKVDPNTFTAGTVPLGTYDARYAGCDKSGNCASVTRLVIVQDTTAPALSGHHAPIARQKIFAEHFHTLGLRVGGGHRPAQGPSAPSDQVSAPL